MTSILWFIFNLEKISGTWWTLKVVFWQTQLTIHYLCLWREFFKSYFYRLLSWCVILDCHTNFLSYFQPCQGIFSIALKNNEPYIRYYKMCSTHQSYFSLLKQEPFEYSIVTPTERNILDIQVAPRIWGSLEYKTSRGLLLLALSSPGVVGLGR